MNPGRWSDVALWCPRIFHWIVCMMSFRLSWDGRTHICTSFYLAKDDLPKPLKNRSRERMRRFSGYVIWSAQRGNHSRIFTISATTGHMKSPLNMQTSEQTICPVLFTASKVRDAVRRKTVAVLTVFINYCLYSKTRTATIMTIQWPGCREWLIFHAHRSSRRHLSIWTPSTTDWVSAGDGPARVTSHSRSEDSWKKCLTVHR